MFPCMCTHRLWKDIGTIWKLKSSLGKQNAQAKKVYSVALTGTVCRSSGREVQPLAALYPTVRLSPWRQVRKNIHSRVWTPGPTWSVLHPGGPPLLVPLSSWTGGYGPHPRRLIRTPVQGGYPCYHSILSPPRRASLLVPLSLDLSASLPPEFCPLPFGCFLCGTDIKHLCENTANWKTLLSSD